MKTDSMHLLISGLKSKGVVFSSDGVNSLRLRAPSGIVSPDLRAYLAEHKTEVINCLKHETFVREWLGRLHLEFSFPLDLPPEFSERLEDAVVGFIDGSISFEQLETAWARFLEDSKAEREFVEDQL